MRFEISESAWLWLIRMGVSDERAQPRDPERRSEAEIFFTPNLPAPLTGPISPRTAWQAPTGSSRWPRTPVFGQPN